MPSEQPREGARVDALAEALYRAQNSSSEWPPSEWSKAGNEHMADAWRAEARTLLRRLELLPEPRERDDLDERLKRLARDVAHALSPAEEDDPR